MVKNINPILLILATFAISVFLLPGFIYFDHLANESYSAIIALLCGIAILMILIMALAVPVLYWIGLQQLLNLYLKDKYVWAKDMLGEIFFISYILLIVVVFFGWLSLVFAIFHPFDHLMIG